MGRRGLALVQTPLGSEHITHVAVPLATGGPLSPLLSTSARGLSPHCFAPLSSSLVFVPLSLHLFPPLPRFLCSLSLSSPSLQPLQSLLYPRGSSVSSSHTLPPSRDPSLPTSLPSSLVSTLQRLVINASFNCHAHFYAH